MRRVAIAIAVVLGACSSLDRQTASTFEPTGSDTFKFTAKSDIIYPDGGKGAEADRMVWLAQYLRDNHLCPNGYKITSRQSVVIDGPIHEIHYDGVCT
jgi:hypothetical protein